MNKYSASIVTSSIAITFASRLTKPIINLIGASDAISKGALDVKVTELDTDEEFQLLNKNFNQMIDRLKASGTDITVKEIKNADHWLPLTHKESVISEII